MAHHLPKGGTAGRPVWPVFLYVFELLPYLFDKGIYPAWNIRTQQYGAVEDGTTIPGVLDLAYEPAAQCVDVQLTDLRRQFRRNLGNDWEQLSRIWHAYFKVPERIQKRVDEALPPGRGLGVHYRGTDKQTNSWDSNPILQTDFLTLVGEWLAERSDFDFVVAATDEVEFVDRLRSLTTLPIVNLGGVEFHKASVQNVPKPEKADRALVDCVLLSRCQCVIETSSALPSFAKVLNPHLEIYRTAASKVAPPLQNEPYFPVAYIPVLPVKSDKGRRILEAAMAGDWTHDPRWRPFQRKFSARRRKPLQQWILRLAFRAGADQGVRWLVEKNRHRLVKKVEVLEGRVEATHS